MVSAPTVARIEAGVRRRASKGREEGTAATSPRPCPPAHEGAGGPDYEGARGEWRRRGTRGRRRDQGTRGRCRDQGACGRGRGEGAAGAPAAARAPPAA